MQRNTSTGNLAGVSPQVSPRGGQSPTRLATHAVYDPIVDQKLQNLQEKLKEISESVAEALATKESVASIKEELSKMNERILAVEGDLAIDADGDGVADIKQGNTLTIEEIQQDVIKIKSYFKEPEVIHEAVQVGPSSPDAVI